MRSSPNRRLTGNSPSGIPSPNPRASAREQAARRREQRSPQSSTLLPFRDTHSVGSDEDPPAYAVQNVGSEQLYEELATGEHFTVVVRTRPLNDTEVARHGNQECLRLDDGGQSVTLLPNIHSAHHRISSGPYAFKYDHVLDPTCQQNTVFDLVGRVGCEHFLDGYNVAVFAYGQTGAGKTYTMYGDLKPPAGEAVAAAGDLSERAGLVPRCLDHIFAKVETMRARGVTVDLSVSFIEIYNETVIDLLSHDARLLTVRENALRDRTYVDGSTEARVDNVQQCLALLRRGAQNRTVGATAVNKESSRSHSVFTISLDMEEKDEDGKRVGRESHFHLVDLAGSERQKYSKAEGRHLREATNINRSLTAFGKVIMALAAGSKHVPYRDSKLTFLLKNSIGGNSKTFLIANIGASPRTQEETLSTLKFASFAKRPMMHVSRNLTNRDATVEDLKLEIHKLKQLLARGRWQSDALLSHNFTPTLESNKMREQGSVGEAEEGGMADALYTAKLELLLRQALERENDLRMKLMREKEQFRGKLDEYERLCRSLEQCLQSSKMIIKFKDLKLRDMHPEPACQEDAAPEVNPQLVRAKITIRSLQEEINALRGTDAPDKAAEKIAMDQHVAQLSDQVKRLLDKVHELESASSVASTVGQGSQRMEEALLDKEEIITQLDQRLQTATISLEEERRAHISALELVQELREAEEEWARALDDTRKEAQQRHDSTEHHYQTQVAQMTKQLQRKEEAIAVLLHNHDAAGWLGSLDMRGQSPPSAPMPKQRPDQNDGAGRTLGSAPLEGQEMLHDKLREEIHTIERQYEEELEAMREKLNQERRDREHLALQMRALLQEKSEWDNTIDCLQSALDKSLAEYDNMQRLLEDTEGRLHETDKTLADERAAHHAGPDGQKGVQGRLRGEADSRALSLQEQLEEKTAALSELGARHAAVQQWMNRRHEQEVEWLMTIDQKDRDAKLLKEELANMQRTVETQREEIEELREAEEEWVRAVQEAQGFQLHQMATSAQRGIQS